MSTTLSGLRGGGGGDEDPYHSLEGDDIMA